MQGPTIRARRTRDLAILFALVAAVYANSFHAGFTLDNDFQILGDARVHQASAENVGKILSEDYCAPRFVTGVYRPVTTLSLLFNYAVLGGADDPVGYHVVNLLLHFLNTALVYLLALVVLADAWGALSTAALFAAHPIATEAVTNIIGRGDLLAAASVLGGMLLYVRSIDAPGSTRRACLAGLTATTALGLLAKENAVAILGSMLAYDLVYRVTWKRAEGVRGLLRQAWQLFRGGYVALVPAFAGVGLVRALVYRNVQVRATPFLENPLVAAGAAARVLTASKVLGMYLWRLLWPASLSADYSYDAIPVVGWPPAGWEDWQGLVALVGLVAAVALLVRHRRRNPALAFFGLFFVLTMLPTSNLLLVIGTIMGERLAYLPSVGFAGAVVVLVSALGRRLAPAAKTVTPVAARALLALVVVAYGARTLARNVDWLDELHLFGSAVREAPGSFKVHKTFAAVLAASDPRLTQLDRIIDEEERALAIVSRSAVPVEAQSWSLLQSLGEHDEMKAGRLGVGTPDGHARLLRSAELLGQAAAVNRAKEEVERSRTLGGGAATGPPLGAAPIYADLGRVSLELADTDRAADAFRDLVRVAPNEPDAYVGLARVHAVRGELADAAVSLLAARVLDHQRSDVSRMLLEVYQRADPNGCALVAQGGSTALNWSCPLVHDELCAADAQLVQAFRAAKQRTIAAQLAQDAVRGHQCPADAIERALAPER